ncbi:hypothetical protein I317_03139 [Kwoniella heveanensis CBS 569]|nr:hypothetical protein I317_03139 [Kwoniella heveanensis CBS 569]
MAGRISRVSGSGTSTATTGTGTGTITTGTGTSVTIWSDDETEMPGTKAGYGYGYGIFEGKASTLQDDGMGPEIGKEVKEGRLIDYDPPSDHDEDNDYPTQVASGTYTGVEQLERRPEAQRGTEMAPSDKLRELLRMMQQEVEISKPAAPSAILRGGEREKESSPERRDHVRRHGYNPDRRQTGNVEQKEEEENGNEEEAESPPTPPPRINNPYAARRGQRGRDSPTLAQPGRLPSRAAVLLNSTSRSLSPEPEPHHETVPESHRSPPTRLEAFLASYSSAPPLSSLSTTRNPVFSGNAEASTSRSTHLPSHSIVRRDSGSESSIASSRKGKGRDNTPLVPVDMSETSPPYTRRSRVRQRQQPQYPPSSPEPESRHGAEYAGNNTSTESQGRRRRLPPTTPRRVSVDIAPDDSASFARNVGGLEVRAEMELDLDEGLSGIGWSEISESVLDEEQEQEARAEVELDDVEERTTSLRRSVSLDEHNHTQLQARRERSITAQLAQGNDTLRNRNREVSPEIAPSPPRPRSTDPITSASLRLSQTRPTSPKSKPISKSQATSTSYDNGGEPPSLSSTSLPALPEPDPSRLSDEEDNEVDTYSSRRAALFRSTSTARSTPRSAPYSKEHTRSGLSASPGLSRSRSRSGEPDNVDDPSQQSKSGSYRTDVGSKSRLSRHSMYRSPQSKEHTNTPQRVLNVQAETIDVGAEDSPFVRNRMLPRRSPPSRVSPSPDASQPTTSNQRKDTGQQTHRSPEPDTATPASLRRRSPVAMTAHRSEHLAPVQHIQNQPQSVAADLVIPPQPPIRVGMALTPPSTLEVPSMTTTTGSLGTPLRSNGNLSMTAAPTPKPPGAWQYTPKGKVRFTPSPLGKGSPIRASSADSPSLLHSHSRSQSQSLDESVSVHRLKLSPRRAKTPKEDETRSSIVDTVRTDPEVEDEAEAETSLIGRLKESLSGSLMRSKERIPIPRPSTTFTQFTSTLQSAQSKTLSTQQKLEATQQQWLEALSAPNTAMSAGQNARDLGLVVRKGWNWGTWAWWILLEIVVLWSVFRVTLDYATSISHLTSLDPFHPLALPFRQIPSSISSHSSSSASTTWGIGPFGPSNPITLTIPIPSALQSLVGKHDSANFFDLVEGWDLWRMLIGSGIGGGGDAIGAGEGRMLGGVPS